MSVSVFPREQNDAELERMVSPVAYLREVAQR